MADANSAYLAKLRLGRFGGPAAPSTSASVPYESIASDAIPEYEAAQDTPGYRDPFDAIKKMEKKLRDQMAPAMEPIEAADYLASGRPLSEMPGLYQAKADIVNPPDTDEHSAVGFFRNAAKDAAATAQGFMALPVIGWKAATSPELDLVTEGSTGAPSVASQLWSGMKQEYGGIADQVREKGLVGGLAQAVYDKPVSRALDLASIAALVGGAGGAAARLGARGAEAVGAKTAAEVARESGGLLTRVGETAAKIDPLNASLWAWQQAKKSKAGRAIAEDLGLTGPARDFGRIIGRGKSEQAFAVADISRTIASEKKLLTAAENDALFSSLEEGSPFLRNVDGEVRYVEPSDNYVKVWNNARQRQEVSDVVGRRLPDSAKPLTREAAESGKYGRLMLDSREAIAEYHGLTTDEVTARYFDLDKDGNILGVKRDAVAQFQLDYYPAEEAILRERFNLDDAQITKMREASPTAGIILEPSYMKEMPKALSLVDFLHQRFLTRGGVVGKTPPKISRYHTRRGLKQEAGQMADWATAQQVTQTELVRQINGLRTAREVMNAADDRMAPRLIEHLERNYPEAVAAVRAGTVEGKIGTAIASVLDAVQSGKASIEYPTDATGNFVLSLPAWAKIDPVPDLMTYYRTSAGMTEKMLTKLGELSRAAGAGKDVAEYVGKFMGDAFPEKPVIGVSRNAKQIISADLANQAQSRLGLTDSKAIYLLDKFNNLFRYGVLKGAPRWLGTNAVGSLALHAMDRGVIQTLRDMPDIIKIMRDPEPVFQAIRSGAMKSDLIMGLASEADLMKRSHLGAGLQSSPSMRLVDEASNFLANSPNPVMRAVRYIPEKVGNWSEAVERGFRATNYKGHFEEEFAKLIGSSQKAREFSKAVWAGTEINKALAEVLPTLDPQAAAKWFAEARDAAQAWTDYAHINYRDMTPFERNVVKRAFPVAYSFWRGSLLLALTYPVTHPLRVWTLSRIANDIADYKKEQADLEPYMRSSLDLGTDPTTGAAMRLNLAAYNPFGQLGTALAAAGEDGAGIADTLQSVLIGPESLAPLLKVGLEQATGFDVFRNRKFTAPGVSEFSGEKVTPDFMWHIASQFPQSRILLDIATAAQSYGGVGGQSGTQYSTSTPLNPQPYLDRETGRIKTPYSPLRGIGQLFGYSRINYQPEEVQGQREREQHARIGGEWRQNVAKIGEGAAHQQVADYFMKKAKDDAKRAVNGNGGNW